jgi:hypothetical protein
VASYAYTLNEHRFSLKWVGAADLPRESNPRRNIGLPTSSCAIRAVGLARTQTG